MNIKKIFTIALISGTLFTSCNNGPKKSKDNLEEQKSTIDTKLLVGSWEDQSESALNFSLLSDGTAQSDNMETLVYKQWNVKNNQLYLVAESIGNRTSSIDTIVYDIQQLDENQMVLKRDALIFTYKKANKTFTLKGHFIYGHEVRSFSPCGSDKKFWVLDKMDELKNHYEELTKDQKPYTPIFAEIEFIDKGKSDEGFAADYDGVYEVLKVVKTTETTEGDCD